ncbi:glycine-rich RNA-binding protein 2, mitochondrial-like isoform X2 [Silene latifolia]|uniref:glycine-rich RNA-binding protein 2, mitochondrial-like isoform X2 n=1 Tax=Silene latifolia TaxID=37657 RepID=UPI003D76D627
MALFRQAGSILKQTISQNSASSMLNSVRYMSNKLFVGARIIVDRDTGRSRGFGFVDFADDESAKNALAMDGKDLHGRTIRVNFADAKPSAPRGGGYGNAGGYQSGGGGGGYGGGGGGY